MSTRDDLLRAIGESPDDDALRLVYADWLEENGDPDRAAFVRAQLEADREPNRRESLARRRVNGLDRDVYWSWVRELPAWARTLPRWRRGTLHSVQVSARNFLKHGEGLFRR